MGKNNVFTNSKEIELILKSLKVCINTIDLSGVFTSWSDQSVEYFGYTKEEAIGKLHNIDLHASQDEASNVLKTVKENGIFNGIVTLVKKDGTFLSDHLIVTPLSNENGEIIGYTRVCLDIPVELKDRNTILTKNIQLQAIYDIVSLTSGSFFLSEILEKALNKILEITKMDCGIIFLISENGETLVAKHSQGFSRKFVEGVREIRFDEGMTGQAIKYSRTISLDTAHYPTQRLLPYIEKEGLISHVSIPLISIDKPVGALNLSSKKRRRFTFDDFSFFEIIGKHLGTAIEKALLYKEINVLAKRYQNLYEDAPDIYMTLDTTGKILNCNKEATSALNYGKDELIGKNILDIVEPAFHKRASLAHENIIKTGFLNNFECNWETLNKKKLNVVVNSKLNREKGEIYCIARNLTKWERLHDRLFQSQKIYLLAELSKGFSHNFNNILSGILGYATLITNTLKPSDKVSQYVRNIESTALKGADFTQKLLTFSLSSVYKIETFDLNDAALNAVEVVEKSLQKNIKIHLNLSKNPFYIDGDQAVIQQAILSLLQNSFEAMEKGGNLSIETDEIRMSDELSVFFPEIHDDLLVSLSITDTGCGIPYDLQDKVFEPFFTTKHVLNKAGLGLAMVYGVIRKHNGYISFESKPLNGTTFNIYFPKSLKTYEPYKTSSMGVKKGKEGILVVDDEDIIRMLAKDILELKGYTIYLASNGQEAIDIYRQNTDKIQLIVLDIIMPVMDGENAFYKLKEINPAIKVLIASGYTKSEKVQNVLKNGGKGFLQKPFQIEELIGAVRLILDS